MSRSDKNGRREAERLIRIEQSLDRLASLRPRWNITPHSNGQIQCLQSRHKIRVAIPGNGWGKTTTMAMAVDMLIQKDDPFNPDLLAPWPMVVVWVCQKFQQLDILRHQLEDEVWTRPYQWNQSKHKYVWPNGGELHIVSGDSDWEHIQGIPVDMVCFDEHPDRKLWNELMFRRRGKRKTRYMVAATMTLGMTWFIREVVQDWEQWHKLRGLTAEAARLEQTHPDVWVWDAGGIEDNPAMSADDVKHYKSISFASDKELRVRLKGGYADFSGDQVFDQDSLDKQIENIETPSRGSLTLVDAADVKILGPDGKDATHLLRRRVGGRTGTHYVEWNAGGEYEGGYMAVWEKPQVDATYVIGADFAAGLVGRDFDCCVVCKKNENGTLEQVAEARGWWGDATFSEILYSFGVWYFNAFICGERQFGLPTLRRLYDERHYAYIYRGRLESTRSRRPSDLLGHHRSSGDTIIPNLRSGLERGHIVLKSAELMEELRQYQYRPRSAGIDAETANSDQLVTSAPSGMHDDMVMALAYSWHAAREVSRFQMPSVEYSPGTYGAIFDNHRVLRGKAARAILP